MPPATVVVVLEVALCAADAAAIAASEPVEAAIAYICCKAASAALPPAPWVVSNRLRISSRSANWLTVRTR
ncbi:hypothetical protein NB706_003538 [Xanthomonas sacchari]|nr:hypothetical protein [Xanthomonas sacchari]